MWLYSALLIGGVSCFKIAMSGRALYMVNLDGRLVMSDREAPADFVQEDKDPGNSYLRIEGGDRTMDILNGTTDLVLAKHHGRGHQVFSLTRAEDGSFYIKSSVDGRCMKVLKNDKVIATECKPEAEQKFDIIRYPFDSYPRAPPANNIKSASYSYSRSRSWQ